MASEHGQEIVKRLRKFADGLEQCDIVAADRALDMCCAYSYGYQDGRAVSAADWRDIACEASEALRLSPQLPDPVSGLLRAICDMYAEDKPNSPYHEGS